MGAALSFYIVIVGSNHFVKSSIPEKPVRIAYKRPIYLYHYCLPLPTVPLYILRLEKAKGLAPVEFSVQHLFS